VRGIVGVGAYLPAGRLDRAAIAPVAGGGGGKGTRSVASYDEDATTMGVEAGRLALQSSPGVSPRAVYLSTTAPPYLDKTNATAVHAALRLADDALAADVGGAVRSGVAALRLALQGNEPALVVTADVRTGLPGGPDEAEGGDAAAAVLVGDEGDGPVLAEHLGGASATAEFLDRWRTPGDVRSKVWEERFGEAQYLPLATAAWRDALKSTGLTADAVDHVIITGTHARAVRSAGRKLGVGPEALVDDLSSRVGNPGAAAPGLLLTSVLESAAPGAVVALVVLADGADVLLFRTTPALADHRSRRPVAEQLEAGREVPYGRFLAWRGVLPVEPPRRPEPARVSSSAAARSRDWKYGLAESGAAGNEAASLADATGTVTTFTVDRLAYSPSPPVVFAVVDFDGGRRLPLELTDVDVADVAVGARVEMTFRRLSTADGIHNYFWKARPARV
jgi:3-hydroxy-3-methylglutaryl CoA synthase